MNKSYANDIRTRNLRSGHASLGARTCGAATGCRDILTSTG